MVGTKRTGIRNIDNRDARTITTSHVERLNDTQRTFMRRLNRLTLCFSKKLENLEAAFAMLGHYQKTARAKQRLVLSQVAQMFVRNDTWTSVFMTDQDEMRILDPTARKPTPVSVW